MTRAAPAERAAADAVSIALIAELTGRGERATLPPAPAVEPDERAALDAAERDYEMLRPGAAAAGLEAALARIDARGGGLPRASLLRAWLLLAMARAASGDGVGSDAALDRALAIEPALAPDPARYPPPLRERVERRREARVDLAPVQIAIDVVPPTARIELDGEPSERAPHVAPGVHVVRARARGHAPGGRALEVRAEGGERVALVLAPDPADPLSAPGAPGSATSAIDAAATALGATPLIVDVLPRGDRLAVEARRGGTVVRAELPRAAAPADFARAASSLAAALRAPVGGPGEDPVPWIVAGSAVAIGAAIAIGIGVALGGGAPVGFDARGEVVR